MQIKNLDSERVAGFGALDEKWPGQRIVAFDHAEHVPRLPKHVPEAVESVGIKDVARFETRHRFGGGEQILHVVDGSVVVNDIGGLTVKQAWRCQNYAQQRQNAVPQLHVFCLIPASKYDERWRDGRGHPALHQHDISERIEQCR